jgi:fructokinase
MNFPQHNLFIGLGEALFDCFSLPGHSREILGGAPLNATLVAALLGEKLGFKAQLVTRVGQDTMGEHILHELRSRGLASDSVQLDPLHPTGRVNVTMLDSQPQYDIQSDVAWDYLQWTPELLVLASRSAAITFGSLAQRSPQSRNTIRQFLQAAPQAIRLFDVNLRQHYFDAEIVRTSCQLASAVKLNVDELLTLRPLLALPDHDHPTLIARNLLHAFNLQAVILTHGEQGTELITPAGSFRSNVPSFPPEPNADPVGAGDACGAACVIGLYLGWTPQEIVTLANHCGAIIASRAGATPRLDPSILVP